MAITLDGTLGVTTTGLTADTNTLYVDTTNDRVGIGTSSPSTKLHVYNDGDVTQTIGSNTGASIINLTSNSNISGAYNAVLSNTASGQNWYVGGYGSANTLVLGTANTERMRITSAGGISFGSSGTAYGTSGQVLTSNGNAAPTWNTLAVTGTLLNIQYFKTVGTTTYTPTSGTNFVIVECIGGGGGGGGVANAIGTNAGSGGGGGYARKKITSSFSGVAITVGAGGTAGSAGANAGGAGGTSSFGALVSATGGNAGVAGSTGVKITAGGTGSSGDLNVTGGSGFTSYTVFANGGISALFGYYGISYPSSGATAGAAGKDYGGGASGATNGSSGGASAAGAVGGQGIVIVYEYA